MPTLDHENTLRAEGFRVVAGVDEAGRGPLAGPVCVAAVVLPEDFSHPVLNDSKQLSEVKRERLYEEITADARIRWHCVTVEPAEIDRINILQATWEGMRRAALALQPVPNAVLIDGKPVKNYPLYQLALVKGDSLSYSIAAASIIAKVTRDRLLVAMAQRYPKYGFEIHKGYPTPGHLAALRQHGPCPEHRRSFAPVAQLELDLS
ncbi:ribonuclease HII [Prosthecobacter vanneervenii]|uniref:Ribonuclease HII n=1 Tax=Prosthecobacter vanneervenii TaxID=48466 RepID=A0A7W7Y900_9BACT|nr:ribonuclease HII [Prosthecobacter vanneervenii]MBB5031822.1 ribonuclease HII [Prosthecobacter vanneervenii]